MLQRLDVHVQNDTTIRFLFEFQFHFEDASVYKLFFGHKSTDLYQAFLFLSGFCVGVVQKVLKAKTKGSMSTLSYNLHFTPVNKNNKIPKIAICLKEIYTSQKKIILGLYVEFGGVYMLIPSASSLPTAFFFGVFGFRAMVFWQIFWRRWVRLHSWKTWGFGKVLASP